MNDIPGDFMDFGEERNRVVKQLIDQVHEFNLMLVGKNAFGKSALVKSLFEGKITIPEGQSNQGAKLCEYSKLLEENGVRLQLVCIETSKFDTHNNAEYVRYIDERFKRYYKDSVREASWNIKDTMIHCCLYLIPTYGIMNLAKDDIECMKALHEKVNLVPIIAKADIFNESQLSTFKKNIKDDLEKNGIKYFQFDFPKEEDEEIHNIVKSEMAKFPFAVVAADDDKNCDKTYRYRTNRGGSIDIYDTKACDFVSLKKLLMRYCMADLIDTTYKKHYSKFKSELLSPTIREQNLKSIGFSQHEIARIEYNLNALALKSYIKADKQKNGAEAPTPSSTPTTTAGLKKPLTVHDGDRQKARQDRELVELQAKLNHMKLMKERKEIGLEC